MARWLLIVIVIALSLGTPFKLLAAAGPKLLPEVAIAPVLRERLPPGAMAYLRIPSPWGLMGAPDGRVLDRAREHPAHAAAIRSIRAAFAAEPEFNEGPGAITRLLFSHWSGPAEIVLFSPGDAAGPRVLASLPLSQLRDAAELSRLLAQSGIPDLQFDGRGFHQLPDVVLQFDAARGGLLVLGGPGADIAQFEALLSALEPGTTAFAASEARIDQSGQGLFGWIDLQAARPLLTMSLLQMGESGDGLQRIVDLCKSLSFGFGTVAGKGRMSFELEAPGASFLKYLPREPRRFKLNTVEAPAYAGSLSILPAPAELDELRAAVTKDFGEQAGANFDNGLRGIKLALGLDLGDLLAAVGPDLGFFGDRAGDFALVKVRDRARFDQLLSKLDAHPQMRLSQRGPIHQLEIGLPDPNAEPVADAVDRIFGRIRTRLFWLDEGEYLIISSVPQPLRDRQQMGANAPLDRWLLQAHGAAYAESMVLVSSRTEDMAGYAWYAYLGALQSLADLAGGEIDPYSFASAGELELPRTGAASMAVETSPDRLAFSLGYDSTGFDVFAGGQSTLVSIAVVGIVAAIALPVYQDYITRSQVAEGLAAARPQRIAISEFQTARQRPPADLTEAGADADDPDKLDSRYVQIRWQDQTLLLEFHDRAPVNQRVRGLILALGLKADGSWVCGQAEADAEDADFVGGQNPSRLTTVPEKFLPRTCRP